MILIKDGNFDNAEYRNRIMYRVHCRDCQSVTGVDPLDPLDRGLVGEEEDEFTGEMKMVVLCPRCHSENTTWTESVYETLKREAKRARIFVQSIRK